MINIYVLNLFLYTGTPLTMRYLNKACKRVTKWHSLGIQLDIPVEQLDSIEKTYHMQGSDRLKTEMFNKWLKRSPNASWTDLITALRDIDEVTVANDIEQQQVLYDDLRINNS